MRRFWTYFLAGLFFGVAIDFVVPFTGTPIPANFWSNIAVSPPAGARTLPSIQIVDRNGKADRLDAGLTSHSTRHPAIIHPASARPVPEGCDPAFSPLASARNQNFANRCMA